MPLHPSQTAYAKNPKLTKREGEALLVALSCVDARRRPLWDALLERGVKVAKIVDVAESGP